MNTTELSVRQPEFTNKQNPFSSFWMAGYECADIMNAYGNRTDLLTLSGHLQLLDQDYSLLNDFAITTVREGIRWSQVEKRAFHYDWSVVASMIESGKKCGIQQIWDICHFGFPDDLSPLHPQFTKRFVSLCKEFARFYRTVNPDSTFIVTPINEVSFLSWLGGEVGGTAPYALGMGWEVKYRLMRAYIEGVAALKEVDPTVRILTTEPLINVVPPLEATEEEKALAKQTSDYQYQATDILGGYMCPELGGSPEYLDILGFNYYYNNQWVLGFRECLPWANIPFDPRWKPLSEILIEAYTRYHQPIILSETSHPGIHRPNWIEFVANHCADVLKQNIPLWGVCLYPIIDRPDWDELHIWHHSGLWDAELQEGQLPLRVLHQSYADSLVKAQETISHSLESEKAPGHPVGLKV